ncbi:substrate-binding domain-containing protein [Paraburkholderia edwinii]|jgi:ribose transport system substrate-binding protein|uniref:Substrate-binding domain-containing protein n=1 Tax=Paraburkholderia edwinii TaxID=2861782 RepID=A0ABX8UVV4_9BURK|nr:substrate-binding domain-containing protein [Paraburkholderia edwinii]QYD73128.1 substrate-binding domain-containing protein [Paraburkholderia edwinii]
MNPMHKQAHKRAFLARTAKAFGALVLGAALSASFASGAYAQQSAAGKRFAYLTPGLDLPFWRIVGKGVTDTVKAQGGTVTIYDSHNDAATQLKNAQDAVAQGVAGIVISPTDSSTAPSVLQIAARAKVPVVIADIGTNSGDYVSFISSENEKGAYETGKKLAEVMKQKGWDKGGYGISSISLARQNGKLRTEGFRRAMKEAGIPEVALNQMQRYTADETFRFVQDMITAHPDMHGVFVQTDAPTLGAARAIQVAHKQSDIALVAFDGIPQFVDMIKDGTLTASGMQQPYLMGQKAAGAMLDHLAGKEPPKSIVVPVVVVSKDNLDQELPVIKQTVFGGEMK